MTQLIIETFEAICKSGTIEGFHIQDFEGILEEKYIRNVLRKVEAQIAYEKEERIFRENQREYDILIKAEAKNRANRAKEDSNNMDFTEPAPEAEEGS